ncbi:MetQ/NlpA family ABC transporter substrate-binding protein [Lysinibacillus xylanilyticus]|uniref:MetQ/NlpA family ABC transporter substrate-binding protein n=1 Tax=Lysinibacillus xylanilyticus TaxID=582475 RepID=UPI002B242F74|nr:MetQ/NlpA family ABC transporter substrate-binding protein [Lysinibacillus xylanilyticus]
MNHLVCKPKNDLPQNAKVSVLNDVVNFSQALLLFKNNGLIELDKTKENDYTVEDKKYAQLLTRSLDDVGAWLLLRTTP